MRSVDDQWQQLADAVVMKAVSDYRFAIRNYGFDIKPYHKTLKECEKFFRSNWFKTLSGANGKRILEALKKEYENERNAHPSHA